MVPAHGVANGTSDGATKRKIKPLFNPLERKNLTNVQFERHETRLEAMQRPQQQQHRRLIFTTIMPGLLFHFPEPTSPEDSIGSSSSLAPVFILHLNVPEETQRRYQANSSRLLADRSTTSNSISNSSSSDNISNKTKMDKGASTVAEDDDEEEEEDI